MANVPVTGYGFSITDRNAGLPFGVPTIRSSAPHADGNPTALDVCPNGTGGSNGAGKAWTDVCNADLISNEGAPVACVRLAAFQDHVELGVYAYNGHPAVPLKIKVQGNTVGWLDPATGDLHLTGKVYAADFIKGP